MRLWSFNGFSLPIAGIHPERSRKVAWRALDRSGIARSTSINTWCHIEDTPPSEESPSEPEPHGVSRPSSRTLFGRIV